MNFTTATAEKPENALRLSHGLVALHAGGIVLLILVVLSTAIWISSQQNRLALEFSQRLVANRLESDRAGAYALVRDYSLWDEAFAAIRSDDRDWLYSNIGTSVTELGTFDLAILVPDARSNFGWVAGSPPDGAADILPAEFLAALRRLLEISDENPIRSRTTLADFDGTPWIFAVSRVTPVEGVPPGVQPRSLPFQVHGTRLTQERLESMGRTLLATKITLSESVASDQGNVALTDSSGKVISHVVWDAPRPGAKVLRKAAIPLALVLGLATAISAVSSIYTVRSARRLERALLAARTADRSRTEFLSNVSHELRTPMNGVLGAIQLLQTTNLDAEQHELVELLMSSATAQMSLISDLIDVTRIESGNRKLEAEPFAPVAVLNEVTEMMKVAACQKGIRLETAWLGLDKVRVRGDARAFRQILTNLVGNAVKFTDRGGVEVMAAALQRRDRVKLTVRVADTGPGIPETAIPHIFERFYQADGSMSRAAEGTGLGLAISQKLALAMGADIDVTSQRGSGSTFVLTVWLDAIERPGKVSDAA